MFPFKAGRQFTIEILVDETETLWALDGDQYCSYTHRNPSPFVAEWVQVTGIRDATLKVQKTDNFPVLSPIPLEVSKTFTFIDCFNLVSFSWSYVSYYKRNM